LAVPDEFPLQPAEVRTEGQQQAGGAVEELIPAKRIGEGLRPTMIEEVADAIAETLPARAVFGALGREANRRLDAAQGRGDRLQEELMREKVAHARTDERLRTGQMQSGAQLLLQIVGSVALGYGLARLETAATWAALAWCVSGLIIAVFGCWPIISLRIGRYHDG